MKITKMHEVTDRVVAASIARDGARPPCGKGCFYCCREPVFAELAEVRGLLEMLSPEQVGLVRAKTSEWLLKFKATGLRKATPNVFKYRAALLWCPLLAADGTCMVYERRLFSCRMHIAKESAEGCKSDELRPRQVFLSIPELSDAVGRERVDGLEPGEELVMDNLGTLLALELLGEDEKTADWMRVTRNGEAVNVEFVEDAKE